MRGIVGTIAGFGLAVTVAAAQQPVPRERAAILLPPQAITQSEMGPIARGVADEPPSAAKLPTTPVVRPTNMTSPAASSPHWTSGVNPNLITASGTVQNGGGVRQLSPAPVQPRVESAPSQKLIERFRIGESQPQNQQQPSAGTAFRGTSVSGAPVYAGPPAYRWYGWGTVTPGANMHAPGGLYPKASANWYSITGATPGAFPVPVANPTHPVPGMDPPTYGMTPSVPVQRTEIPVYVQPQPQPQAVRYPAPVSAVPTVPESKFLPGTASPVPTPTLTSAPASVGGPNVMTPTLPNPVATPMPVVVLPPLPAGTSSSGPSVLQSKSTHEPVLAKPVVTEPQPLPTTVTNETSYPAGQWKPASAGGTPGPGTWTPASGGELKPLPTIPIEQPKSR